ncbi:MAG TPA: hypothetical protein VI408_09535 [Gaiellaceae bacterium]
MHVHLAGLSLAVLLVVAAPAQADALPHVTVIGDSSAGVLQWDGASYATLSAGFDVDVESLVCRKLVKPGCNYLPPPESALATVQRLGPALGRIVVIDTGYNDTPTEVRDAIDPLMSALVTAGVEHVVWLDYVEGESQWLESNLYLDAAKARWPQLTVADWNAVALPHPEWFLDAAHPNSLGGRYLASFVHAFLVQACGDACTPQPEFCGLARTRNGFDYVRATAFACAAARATVVAIERGGAGTWVCSRNVDAMVELTCVGGEAKIELLERSPVAAARDGDTVTLANWTFRLRGRTIEGRGDSGRWVTLGRAPWCIPDLPREVLLAFRLKPLTPNGGCFTSRR